MKKIARLIYGAVGALSICYANTAAAVVDCTGEVTSLSLQLTTAGTVTLSLAGAPYYTYLCDVDGSGLNGVSPTVCRTMYATLVTAKTTGKKVLIRFYDHSTCSAVPYFG